MKGTGQGTSRGELGEIRKSQKEPSLKEEIRQVNEGREGRTVFKTRGKMGGVQMCRDWNQQHRTSGDPGQSEALGPTMDLGADFMSKDYPKPHVSWILYLTLPSINRNLVNSDKLLSSLDLHTIACKISLLIRRELGPDKVTSLSSSENQRSWACKLRLLYTVGLYKRQMEILLLSSQAGKGWQLEYWEAARDRCRTMRFDVI